LVLPPLTSKKEATWWEREIQLQVMLHFPYDPSDALGIMKMMANSFDEILPAEDQ
jgi:hypothetical protein